MRAFLWLFDTVISIYIWLVIGQIVMSWLIQFGIVNARQPFVMQLSEFLYRVTEPVLGPIRRRLPDLGGIDISPLILLVGLYFIQILVHDMVSSLARAL
ncbi:MAG TPA: YggT family protein [Beijerinckiaceae bacterium]|nr:YggT family protein [Beijerinckiaceae bacterium]